MGRTLLFFGAMSAAVAAGYYAHENGVVPAITAPKPAPLMPHGQTCADDCEQSALVHNVSETAMRACKARCGEPEMQARPHEVPRSISVAPADHSLGLRPPPNQRITRAR